MVDVFFEKAESADCRNESEQLSAFRCSAYIDVD